MLGELDEPMTSEDAHATAHAHVAAPGGPPIDPSRPTETSADGWLFYADDGEIIGRIDDATAAWRAADGAAVDWALGVRAEIEADLAAVRIRRKAVMDNFDRLERRHAQRLAWWVWRFQPDVVAYARRELAGGKARTLQLENGKVAFRATAGTNKITDAAAALDYVESRDPFKVKVERSVTATVVLKVAAAHGDGPAELAGFLFSTGPGESVVVDTGVGKSQE